MSPWLVASRTFWARAGAARQACEQAHKTIARRVFIGSRLHRRGQRARYTGSRFYRAASCTASASRPLSRFFDSMTLRIHNTLSRSLEAFQPLRAGKVGMYVCGMTIYDLCHMGHLRMMMAFDVVYRWLRTLGYDVTYVRNITDIDDKIIKRALERKITIRALTDEMIAAMHADLGAVGVATPTREPRATDYVPQMLGPDRPAREEGPGLPLVQRRREFRGAQVSRATASSRARASTSCAPASAWRCSTARTTRSTSCSGRPPRPTSPTTPSTPASTAPAARAGTSSARR